MVCNNHRENFNEALSSAKEYKRLVCLEDDQIEIQRALITIGNIVIKDMETWFKTIEGKVIPIFCKDISKHICNFI